MTADHEKETRIINQLLGPGVEVTKVGLIDERDLKLIVGPDMLEQLMTLLGQSEPQEYLPRRGSADYREMLENGTKADQVSGMARGISHLWDDYGWPALVDFMELLIKRLCRYANHLVMDHTGRICLDKIIKINQDEGDLMETAVHISNEPGARDQGVDFTEALELGKRLRGYLVDWYPHFQKAIDRCTAGDEEAMRPILVRLPELRTNRERAMQGVLVLAMATMAVSNPQAAMDNLVAAGGADPSELPPALLGTKRSKGHK